MVGSMGLKAALSKAMFKQNWPCARLVSRSELIKYHTGHTWKNKCWGIVFKAVPCVLGENTGLICICFLFPLAQFWSRLVVAIPMVLCATSPSCTTTATTLTVLLRDGETTWSGVEPLRTMMLTRNLVSAQWPVRPRTIKGLWSTCKWLFELESKACLSPDSYGWLPVSCIPAQKALRNF